MSKLRLEMPSGKPFPTHVFVEDKEIHKVKSIQYTQSVDEVPTAIIELAVLDGFETDFADIQVSFTPQTIEEAKTILRNAGIKEV